MLNNTNKAQRHREIIWFIALSWLFIAFLSILNIISVKIVSVGPLVFSFGSYLYAITYPITDTVSEIWGRRVATRLVLAGFAVNLLVVVVIYLSVLHPPAEFWAEQDSSYGEILGLVPRILLASMCAYLMSQLHDVYMFHYIKKLTRSNALWLRNTLSTALSQGIDSVVFTLIAFAGTQSTAVLINIIISQYIIKLIIALVDTPIVYLLVRKITGGWIVESKLERKNEI